MLTFSDGTKGEIDLADWVVGAGGVFEALENPAFFRQVFVNQELGTIQWPNNVDFCPDVLYSRLTGRELPTSFEDPATRTPS
jgi:hypothetical protein